MTRDRPAQHRPCTFVPPWLLERIGATDSLVLDEHLRARRASSPTRLHRPGDTSAWTVHTAGNGMSLPGEPLRSAGESASGDVAVDEAADAIAATLVMFADGFGRSSYDDAGAPVTITVHYGRDYDNAFWDGHQLVFGDGDGSVFERFTKPADVLAHEFGHAVTDYSAGLIYQDQAGALNESISDVFAACLKQQQLRQSADVADWLIGEGLFVPAISARGLRDMAAPGTAYDDPVLGRDPQVGHLDDYVETDKDNGGVHINSGIPNRAFQLAAVGIGGTSLEGAGQIWYAALTVGTVPRDADFAAFAAATVAAAGGHADTVRSAWSQVGVTPRDRKSGGSGPSGSTPNATNEPVGTPAGTTNDAPTCVSVTRSGGFAGRIETGIVDLDGPDPSSVEARRLVEAIDLDAAVAAASLHRRPVPDGFVYTFWVRNREPVRLPERALTPELAALAALVLLPENAG